MHDELAFPEHHLFKVREQLEEVIFVVINIHVLNLEVLDCLEVSLGKMELCLDSVNL